MVDVFSGSAKQNWRGSAALGFALANAVYQNALIFL
jgi:hypothetical protein